MTKPSIVKLIGTEVAFALGGVGAVFPHWMPALVPVSTFILGALHVTQPGTEAK